MLNLVPVQDPIRGQLDILKGHNSEWLPKDFIPKGYHSEVLISKGH